MLYLFRDTLLSSENNLRIANNNADDLTIRKLAYENPNMAEKFADLKKDHKDD